MLGRARRLSSTRTAARVVSVGLLVTAGGFLGTGLVSMGQAGWVISAAAFAGMAIGCGTTLALVNWRLSRPLASIAESIETLAARDVLALVDEFADLAQGDSPRPLKVHAMPVALPSDRSVRRVAQALNTTISRLHAGAHQFTVASGEAPKRLFYVGPDDYLLGGVCAEAMGGRLPGGSQVMLVVPDFPHNGAELRRRGFESMLRDRFPHVEVVVTLENHRYDTTTTEAIRSFIRTHPRLAGIYCTDAVCVLPVIDALAATDPASLPIVICHDITDATIAGIQSGLVSAAITQDPFGQGHDTAVHLFNAVAHGWRPTEPRIITPYELITLENYRLFWRPYESAIESPQMMERRARPLGTSERHLRIAVLGLGDCVFWDQVRKGVDAAAEELAQFNAAVSWIVPERDGTFDLALRGPVVEALVRDGYDAIASVVHSNDLLPYLNRAVDAGLVVASINSETSSLQALVATLSKQRRQLEIEASGLEVAAHHDPLTGTLNRVLMDRGLEEVRTSVATTGKPATVVMIDIDHFKAYNDRYGHTEGDEVLRQVARRIQHEIRPTDRLYRYGGEEFLVVLRDTSLEVGDAVAVRIACGITTLGIVHAGNPPWGVVTVSAGVAGVDPASESAADCVANADSALYRSKRSGRNTVATYQPEP